MERNFSQSGDNAAMNGEPVPLYGAIQTSAVADHAIRRAQSATPSQRSHSKRKSGVNRSGMSSKSKFGPKMSPVEVRRRESGWNLTATAAPLPPYVPVFDPYLHEYFEREPVKEALKQTDIIGMDERKFVTERRTMYLESPLWSSTRSIHVSSQFNEPGKPIPPHFRRGRTMTPEQRSVYINNRDPSVTQSLVREPMRDAFRKASELEKSAINHDHLNRYPQRSALMETDLMKKHNISYVRPYSADGRVASSGGQRAVRVRGAINFGDPLEPRDTRTPRIGKQVIFGKESGPFKRFINDIYFTRARTLGRPPTNSHIP